MLCVLCVRAAAAQPYGKQRATDITAKPYPRLVIPELAPGQNTGSMGHRVNPVPSCGLGHGGCFHNSNNIGS